MNAVLQSKWTERRGISVVSIALNPITLTPEDLAKIQQMEDAAAYATNPAMMGARIGEAQANAMESAASNPNGAMMGFMGMGMAQQAGGANVANMFAMGQQQQAQQQAQQPMQQNQQANASANGWTCECGTTNTGKFCQNCGKSKPVDQSWTCECGTTNTGNFCQNCGKQKPLGDWTCECGTTNSGKFCQNCGKPRQ